MNSNEEMERPAEVSQPEAAAPQSPFVGGEITIVADPRTGAINVSAPSNMVVALGLLETAKAILIQKQQENMRGQALRRPAIVPAGADALLSLRKPN